LENFTLFFPKGLSILLFSTFSPGKVVGKGGEKKKLKGEKKRGD